MKDITYKLVEGIQTSSVLEVIYKGKRFIYEPYLLYDGPTGVRYIHGYKVSGEYEKCPPPHFCNLFVDFIDEIKVVDKFRAPIDGYKSASRMFHKVLCKWEYNP